MTPQGVEEFRQTFQRRRGSLPKSRGSLLFCIHHGSPAAARTPPPHNLRRGIVRGGSFARAYAHTLRERIKKVCGAVRAASPPAPFFGGSRSAAFPPLWAQRWHAARCGLCVRPCGECRLVRSRLRRPLRRLRGSPRANTTPRRARGKGQDVRLCRPCPCPRCVGCACPLASLATRAVPPAALRRRLRSARGALRGFAPLLRAPPRSPFLAQLRCAVLCRGVSLSPLPPAPRPKARGAQEVDERSARSFPLPQQYNRPVHKSVENAKKFPPARAILRYGKEQKGYFVQLTVS